jgi:hypothetical protein
MRTHIQWYEDTDSSDLELESDMCPHVVDYYICGLILTPGMRTHIAATWSLSDTSAGRMSGRKESECGLRGVRRRQGTSGCTIEPPACRMPKKKIY